MLRPRVMTCANSCHAVRAHENEPTGREVGPSSVITFAEADPERGQTRDADAPHREVVGPVEGVHAHGTLRA